MELTLVAIDQDGFLNDFIGGVAKVFGFPSDWCPSTYNGIAAEIGISETEFWKRIEQTPGFWRGLKPKPEGIKIAYSIVHDLKLPAVIATSPVLDPECAADKIRWINDYIPFMKRDYAITPVKFWMSGMGRILIDDSASNIKNWEGRGGHGILVRLPFNEHYSRARRFEEILPEIQHIRNIVSQINLGHKEEE